MYGGLLKCSTRGYTVSLLLLAVLEIYDHTCGCKPFLKSLPLHASISISTLFLPFLMLSPIYSALSLHPSILFISLFHILHHYSL